MWVSACVRRSLAVNGGLHNATVKLSDCIKPESFNAATVSGSKKRHLFWPFGPLWFEPLNEFIISEQDAHRRHLPESRPRGPVYSAVTRGSA